MNIHLIIAQRKETYEGEYAPEVLGAIDEYGNDENAGEWIEAQLKKHRADPWLENVQVATIEVSRKEIDAILRPQNVLRARLVANPVKPC